MPHHRHTTTPAHSARRRTPILALAAGLALTLGACGTGPEPELAPDPLFSDIGSTVSEIAEEPLEYAGEVVTVSGEVDRILAPRAFTIGGDDFIGQDELLVVGPSSVPALVNQLADSSKIMNDIVQVTGEVQVFQEDTLERILGADLDDDLWDNFDGKAVLVMRELDVTPRNDMPLVATPAAAALAAPIVDEMVIVAVPDRMPLAGRTAALLDVKVQTVLGDSAFWVGPTPSQRLLVVVSDSAETWPGMTLDIEPGQTLAVAGVLRTVPADMSTIGAQWHLSPAEQMTVSHEQIYLDATAVHITSGAMAASMH